MKKYAAITCCAQCPHWAKDLNGCRYINLRSAGGHDGIPSWCPLPDVPACEKIKNDFAQSKKTGAPDRT